MLPTPISLISEGLKEESRNSATPPPPTAALRGPGPGSELRQALERGTGTRGAWLGRGVRCPKAPQPPGARLDICRTELCPRPLRRGLLGATSDRGRWGCRSASPLLWKLLWRGPGECGDPLHLSPAIWGVCHGRERPRGENPRSVPRMHWQGLPWGSVRPQAAACSQPPGPPPGPAHWDPGLGAPAVGSLGGQRAQPSRNSVDRGAAVPGLLGTGWAG